MRALVGNGSSWDLPNLTYAKKCEILARSGDIQSFVKSLQSDHLPPDELHDILSKSLDSLSEWGMWDSMVKICDVVLEFPSIRAETWHMVLHNMARSALPKHAADIAERMARQNIRPNVEDIKLIATALSVQNAVPQIISLAETLIARRFQQPIELYTEILKNLSYIPIEDRERVAMQIIEVMEQMVGQELKSSHYKAAIEVFDKSEERDPQPLINLLQKVPFPDETLTALKVKLLVRVGDVDSAMTALSHAQRSGDAIAPLLAEQYEAVVRALHEAGRAIDASTFINLMVHRHSSNFAAWGMGIRLYKQMGDEEGACGVLISMLRRGVDCNHKVCKCYNSST